jgi:flagellar motor switch/type III secretory pathway protein FliN
MSFRVATSEPGLLRKEALLVLQDDGDAQAGPRQAVLYGAAMQTVLQPALADVGSELAAQMAQYIARDLLVRLARLTPGSVRRDALFPPVSNGPAQAGMADGSALLTLGFGRDELMVWMSHGLLSHWYEGRGRVKSDALVSRQEALAARCMPFRLLVGNADLALADLVRLEPGDVILLDAGIDKPLTLESVCGNPIARGYLGLRQGAAAVQICK